MRRTALPLAVRWHKTRVDHFLSDRYQFWSEAVTDPIDVGHGGHLAAGREPLRFGAIARLSVPRLRGRRRRHPTSGQRV